MDLLLAKAKPITHGGSTSGVYLRRGEKSHQELLQPETGVRRCERNSSADPKVSAEGEAGGSPGTRAEIPLQPVKTMGQEKELDIAVSPEGQQHGSFQSRNEELCIRPRTKLSC
ncbi:E3 ubiquitin-protein ligase MARCHF3 [Grus japonensis]|uniref:E3 ubiquitin-protein ligase MARCHF3 n=1 Tax=Grus japonensis TaxID=30415 RepID=A0ABC9WIN5_GRUJA